MKSLTYRELTKIWDKVCAGEFKERIYIEYPEVREAIHCMRNDLSDLLEYMSQNDMERIPE